MTRKRFVKLLMSEGLSRNEANDLAKDALDGYSYEYLHLLHRVTRENPDFLDEFFISVQKTITHVVEVLPSVIESIVAALPAAIEKAVSGIEEEIRKLKAMQEATEVNNE